MKRTSTLLYIVLFLVALDQSYGQSVPEILYYRFNGSGSSVPNLALSPPAGTATATIMGGQTQGGIGQCNGALNGTGASSSSDYVNTNWATNLTGMPWTLSFWTNNVPSTTTTYYILGDVNAGGFRVFTGGVAGAGNWILRGGFTDVLASGGASTGPSLTTFVYDTGAHEIRSYVNGILMSTVAQGAVSITGTGPFKVGAYSASNSLPSGSLMDEFRLYSRALSVTEIQQLMITASTSTQTITACNSYTVPSGNQTYTTSGTYMDTIPNVVGCDSVMTINLTILNNSSSTRSVTTCNSYTAPSGNQTFTISGTYTDTIPNVAGCDSIITINLTILNSSSSTQSVTACYSYTVPSGNQTYTMSGTYMDTIPNLAGCDSVITIHLTINSANVGVTANGFVLTAAASSAIYQWIDCSNNQPVLNGTGQSYTATANGNYAVIVTENSCTDTSSCFIIAGIGMSENPLASGIVLYPNPTEGQFTLTCGKKQDELWVEIISPLGETTQREMTTGTKPANFNIKGAAGIYLVRITNEHGEKAQFRMIKE